MKKLTSAEDAIEQAFEAGYELPWVTKKHIASMRHRGNQIVVLTDPLFWTALGKVRGWGQPIDKGEYDWGQRFCLHCGIDTAFQPPRESGCNHVHYPEACKQCNDKKITAEEHSEEWFDTHVWHPDRETLFWQNLP